MSDETITYLVLAATVVVFVLDRLPVAVVALGVALSLWATGVLDLEQSPTRRAGLSSVRSFAAAVSCAPVAVRLVLLKHYFH